MRLAPQEDNYQLLITYHLFCKSQNNGTFCWGGHFDTWDSEFFPWPFSINVASFFWQQAAISFTTSLTSFLLEAPTQAVVARCGSGGSVVVVFPVG